MGARAPAAGRSAAIGWAAHCARINTVLSRDDALKVKSAACPGSGRVNVALTGAVVPNGNAGTDTSALKALITESPCRPDPTSAMSTVTKPGPAVIDWNAAALPGNTSVTVSVGEHGPLGGVGVGVAFGVAVGTGVGVAVGVGVGLGVGVAVGAGVGVGAGPPAHWARIRIAFTRDDARSVKSTGCPGFGIENVAPTGLNVPDGNAGMATFALSELISVKPCRPIPELTGSTVTEFGPAVIAENAMRLPGTTSVTVSDGVQMLRSGVGVGTGVGVGVAVGTGLGVGVAVALGVGVTVGVGVGVAVGAGVGVGVGVGIGPPGVEHE
jgi:hypothetical protein